MSCGPCDGRCCAVFYFPSSPAQIRAKGFKRYVDGKTISRMLVPLDREAAKKRIEAFSISPPGGTDEWIDRAEGSIYTCKHWDEDSRLCTIYDKRPQMCADYPYRGTCQHGCGYTLPQAHREDYDARVAAPPNRRREGQN